MFNKIADAGGKVTKIWAKVKKRQGHVPSPNITIGIQWLSNALQRKQPTGSITMQTTFTVLN